METPKPSISVFFDGKCHLCSREIVLYAKQDKKRRIRFVDISSDAFDPGNYDLKGIDLATLEGSLHAMTAEGNVLTGLDSFVAIWKALERYRPMVALVEFKPLRPALDMVYEGFAWLRPKLPKMAQSSCQGGTCELR